MQSLPMPCWPFRGVLKRLVAVVEQRGELRVGLEDDRAAVAAVSAGRAAVLDELLAPEGDCAVSAVTGLHVNA